MNLKKLHEAIRIIKKIPAKKLRYSSVVVTKEDMFFPNSGCAGAWLGKKWNTPTGRSPEDGSSWYCPGPIGGASRVLACSYDQENKLFFDHGGEPNGQAYKSWWLKRARKIARQVKAHRARARKQTLQRAAARAK